MGPHRKVGIYVGFQSPSIIKYLEPLIGDLFTARFADSIFDEEHFPTLGGEFKYQKECQEINWNTQCVLGSDPRTLETELQVQKIIHLQMNCQMHSLITNMSLNHSFLLGMHQKEWKYRVRPLNS
jgi:hypothetical protein